MIIQLTHTTTGEISSALLRARRSAGSPAMGMVLTLLVVCDEKEYESALQAAMEAGREHPARILLVVRAAGRAASLDAEVRIGEGDFKGEQFYAAFNQFGTSLVFRGTDRTALDAAVADLLIWTAANGVGTEEPS